VNRADPHGSKADSCGLPFFRARLGILDEAGKAQPQGKVGEVAKRGLLTGPVYLPLYQLASSANGCVSDTSLPTKQNRL
jgi:hypothetical protein